MDYYHLCNEADRDIYHKDYEAALDKFEKAFELVDYVHAENYEKAGAYALQVKDYEKGYLYAKGAILNGSSSEFWERREFKLFRKTQYYNNLIDSSNVWKEQHLASLNMEYNMLIDSLYYIDQRIIRKTRHVKGNYKIDKKKLPSDLYELDASNFQTLLAAIEKYGFPSEKIIGFEGYQKALIIVHHNFRLKENEVYHPIVIEALRNGEYMPIDFAHMYEQYNRWSKDQTFFTVFDRNLSEENLKKINANRLKYGLKDLSAYKLKRNGLSMKKIW